MAEEISKDDLKKFIKGSVSFKYFAENIVEEVDGIAIKIPKFQEDWVSAALRHKMLVIKAQRGSGKTNTMCVLFPLYITTYYPNKSFLIISPTEDQSLKVLDKLRALIETRPLLKFLKPTSVTAQWNKYKAETSNDCKFICRCMNSNVRGHHVDYLLAEEAGEINTPDKIDTFISAALPTIYTKNGSCIAIGTPQSERDLLATLARKKRYFTSLSYPAINPPKIEYGPNKGKPHPQAGKPLWSERFSIADLNRIEATIGKSRFEREYLVNINYSDDRVFDPEVLLKCEDDTIRLQETGFSDKIYYIGVDLATSPKGDYSVFAVIEEVADDRYKLVHVFRKRGLAPAIQESILEELCNKFPPRKLIIDESNWGGTMVSAMRSLSLPVQGYNFAPGRRSILINTLEKTLREDKLKIPFSDFDKQTTSVFLEELSGIIYDDGKSNKEYPSRKRHDDFVIAVGLALYAASKYKKGVCYGVSNTSNIYNNSYIYGGSKSYIQQIQNERKRLSNKNLK